MIFTIQAKGTTDAEWTVHEVAADNLKDAQAQADTIYGVVRDKDGKQTNAALIKVKVAAKK